MIKKHLLAVLFMLFYSWMTADAQSNNLPAGYNWATMQQTRLEASINEVSGLVWDEAHQEFLAEEDEDGILYVLDKTYKIKAQYRFAKKGDYEDIAIANGLVYLLRSDGKVYEMKYDGHSVSNVNKYDYPGETAEFETLLFDKAHNQLLLITKNAKLDKRTETTHAFAFDLATKQFKTKPALSLPWNEIRKMAGKELDAFKPSAAAIHPLTGDIYILASVEKILAVYNSHWQLKHIVLLDPLIFLQPESITFDSKGNLYIANEANVKHPMLQFFPYKR